MITDGLHLSLINSALVFTLFVLLGDMFLDAFGCASTFTTLANEYFEVFIDNKAYDFKVWVAEKFLACQ